MAYLEFAFYIIFIISVFSFVSLAPWAPTRNSDYKRINEVLDLKPGENFLEMGCGTGKLSIFLAKNNPSSNIVGIELSPLFYLISKINAYFSKQKNLKIIYGNALKKDLSKFEAIYIFGLPDTITQKLLPKIKDILKPNFRMISYCFEMKNEIFFQEKFKPENKLSIYKYTKK